MKIDPRSGGRTAPDPHTGSMLLFSAPSHTVGKLFQRAMTAWALYLQPKQDLTTFTVNTVADFASDTLKFKEVPGYPSQIREAVRLTVKSCGNGISI
jgi:hypothetical protein